MVQHLAGVLLALVELLEAEAARFNASVRRLVLEGAAALAFATAAGALLALGGGFVVWAAFTALRPPLGEPLAALVVGVSLLSLVGGATWLVFGRMRRRREPA